VRYFKYGILQHQFKKTDHIERLIRKHTRLSPWGAFFYGQSKADRRARRTMTNMKSKWRDIEPNNRLRIYNACKHYHFSTTTNISKLHHKIHLDDLTVGLCTLVGASQQLIKEETYGRNP